MTTVAAERLGRRVTVTGVVQGVGFRPFVYRLAERHGLAGGVCNESGEVQIDVEGPAPALDAFVAALSAEAPPLARIERVAVEPRAATGRPGFVIRPSIAQADRRQPISPDVALCPACEAELFDPANRRAGYPFITCTDCGPRFTVIEDMPYDRERTSMRAFPMCPACRAEYETPGDRRYHSETNSCPACGPRVWLEAASQEKAGDGTSAIASAARLLRAGLIVAVRGLGGFHLAVDATDEAAVLRLRRRKHRDAKPLAIMVRTLDAARLLATVSPAEAALLTSRERPIVLLHRRPDAALAASIAPGLDTVGVMLAYTPLHHLLLAQADRPLVMTSGNVSEEPIATANDDARARLAGIADALLLHDREIVARYDDSVVRVAAGVPVFLRRARSYAPLPVDLPVASPRPLVAVGPHLKNTFALVHGRRAYVSQHIGDLENLETLNHFRAALAAYQRLFRITPEVAVRDLHPGYLSTRIAGELGIERVIAVQHHHAHVAAVLAEHGLHGPAVGVAFDGTGHGTDGHVWGAEVLVASLTGFSRAAHLRYAPLPGGDVAARQPWRVLLGYASLDAATRAVFAPAWSDVPAQERDMAEAQIARRLNAPLASSLGRLFDAAAAALGVRVRSRYEGQAAMELEALAGLAPAQPLPFAIADEAGVDVLDPLPLLVALAERRAAGDAVPDLAARFHETVAAAADTLAARAAARGGLHTVALSGGCFQNRRLLESLSARLAARGLHVLVPRQLSPNDGAISYGQAAVAAALLHAEEATP